MCFAPQQHARFRHPNLQKWSEHVVFLNAFNMFNSKAASHHNSVHFFNIHLQKWSEHVVLLTHRNVLRATTAFAFSTSKLPKVLRTRCALHIVTSKCASSHNGVQFFNISTSKSALRCSEHEVLSSFWLRSVLHATAACKSWSLILSDGSAPVTLVNLLFDPPEPLILGKTLCFATFLPFRAPWSSFFWIFLFSDIIVSSFLFSD